MQKGTYSAFCWCVQPPPPFYTKRTPRGVFGIKGGVWGRGFLVIFFCFLVFTTFRGFVLYISGVFLRISGCLLVHFRGFYSTFWFILSTF